MNQLNALMYLSAFWPATGREAIGQAGDHGPLEVPGYLRGQLTIFVEDPSQNVTFNHNLKLSQSLSKVDLIKRARTREKISRNVGMNQAYATLFIEELRLREHRLQVIVPGRSDLLTKLADERGGQLPARLFQQISSLDGRKIDADLFHVLTGWVGPSSQHARDAWLLVL